MAKLIPALILFFYFSLLLSSSHAESPIASSEDDVTKLPPATFSEEDVSDLKPLIVLPTDNQLNSDAVSLVNGERNRLESEKFSGEFQEMDVLEVKSFDEGEKKLDRGPMNRRFDRMRPIPCRHRRPRFGGGAQIRPRKMPFWKEENDAVMDDERHHRHHHGERFDGPRFHEVDPARFAGVDGDGRMIGEFKQPHFFFRRHHHNHRHHHDDDDDDFHHGEEEEREHHRHGRGRGFWSGIRNFMGHF